MTVPKKSISLLITLGILFGIFGFCALCGIIGKLNNKNSNSEVALKSKLKVKGEPFWVVRLKLRAKNAFGGYILKDTFYFIRQNEVVAAEGL